MLTIESSPLKNDSRNLIWVNSKIHESQKWHRLASLNGRKKRPHSLDQPFLWDFSKWNTDV